MSELNVDEVIQVRTRQIYRHVVIHELSFDTQSVLYVAIRFRAISSAMNFTIGMRVTPLAVDS